MKFKYTYLWQRQYFFAELNLIQLFLSIFAFFLLEAYIHHHAGWTKSKSFLFECWNRAWEVNKNRFD